MAVRSPLCKARKGGFKDMGGQELLIAFFKVGFYRCPAETFSWPKPDELLFDL